MTGKSNLIWHTFSEHLPLIFKELFEEEKYSDVTLVSDDQIQFKAHKIVLSACSPVFKKIIDNNPSQHPLIYLRGIQSYEMESILQFMYLGEGRFQNERMEEFLKVAQDLELKEISTDVVNQSNKKDAVDDEDDQPKQTTEKQIRERQSGNQQVFVASSTVCPECGKEFSCRKTIVKHYKSKHEGIKYPCNQCDSQFTERGSLQIHIQSKHEGIKHSCNQCDHQATTQGNLQKHIHLKHEGFKYSCHQCDFETTQKTSLKTHIEYKHEGITYPCSQCDFEAAQLTSLKHHFQSKHEGIKYPCNQCNFESTTNGNLQQHIKSKHEGIKYPCNHCDYEAPRKNHLKRHIQFRH